MSRVFWDTNLFIYLFEDRGEPGRRVRRLRERMLERGDALITSALTLGEVQVKPIEAGRPDLANRYAAAIQEAAHVVVFDAVAAATFASLRAGSAVRSPDAIQLSCAARAGADLFITNDDRLTRMVVPGIQFVTSLDRAPL